MASPEKIAALLKRLELYGSMKGGNKMIMGGGEIATDIPIGKNTTITPSVGGGGAKGKVSTRGGDFAVNEFEPSVGLRFTKRFK